MFNVVSRCVFKRIISWVLVLVFLCGVFITPVSAATGESSGANSHIQAYISWSAGKKVSIEDFKNAKFTQDELQFLGVYLSNFFVPFGTELGSTDAVTKQNKEDMKQALQTSLAFEDEMAASFVETTLKLSRDTTQELKLYVSKDYQQGLVEVPDVPLNYYTALSCMLGGLKEVLNEYPMEKEKAEIKQIKAGYYDYGYWGYIKNGNVVPVFDFDIDLSSLTPSNTAFIKCLESVDMKNGYGTAFFDFKKDEVATDKGSFGLVNKSVNADQAYQMSAYGMKLNVDCFGNLIVKGANHQVIAVPGCMNPYVWQEVDAKGATVGQGLGGTAFNLASVPALSLQTGSGVNTLFSNISKSSADTADQVTESGDQEIRVDFTGTLGSSNITNAGKELGYLKALLNYSMGYENGETGQYNIFYTGNTVGITGKASELVRIDKNRISYENLEKNKRGDLISLKNKLAEYIEKSKVNGQNWVIIDTNFEEAAKKAQEQLQGKPVTAETSKVGVRSGLVATNVLMSNLNDMKGQLYADLNREYSMRLVRGSSDSAINTAGIIDVFSENGIKELIKSCEKGFKTANPNAYNYFLGSHGGLATNYWREKSAHDIQFNANVGDGSEVKGSRTTTLFDSFVFIDNLGAMNYNNSAASIDFKPINILSYFDSSKAVESTKNAFGSWASSPSNGYTNMYKDIQEGKSIIPQGVSSEALVGIYITYAYASLYDESNKKDTIGKLGYKMNSTALPEITSTALTLSAGASEDIMLNSIRDWLYYLLNPTEGIDYFRILISNKVNGLLVGWHEDMVGSDGTGLVNGTTYYRGDTGYVTTPELEDVPWIDSFINFFLEATPYLIILMMLLLVAVYLGGSLSLQRCLLTLLVFVFALALPLPIINNIVGASNRVATELYGEKFTYWALVQHQSYSDEIDKAAENGDYSNYLRTLYEQNSKVSANQGSESVMLKWQTSKKLDSLMLDDKKSGNSIFKNRLLSTITGSSAYSGENYLKNPDSLYMYRSYIDISNFSRYIHRGLATGIQPINMSLDNTVTASWYDTLREAMRGFETLYEYDRNQGYCNPNGDGSTSGNGASLLRVKLPLSSRIVTDAFNGRGTVKDLQLGQYVGINQGAFNFSIPMFNTKDLDYHDQLNSKTFKADDYSPEDYSALAAYGLMSENVFYYFSWDLYESGLSTESSSTREGFKDLLLDQENAGFFYNTKGNGEMKDFMDMRSLFTYTIPYLKQGNDLVDEWDDTYGLFFYEGVPTEEGKEKEVENNPELKQKYWHNLNVARLHGVWTPWVDLMYDCSYAKAEKIHYLGEEYFVQDPINPASYPVERPMVFSRTEMADYGLKVNQLTAVERKIIECNDGMEERMFKLLNYYKFNDTVLNTAAAMNCSFEFNKTFSENGLLGESFNIYPQSFELADFSYDAFLRFILSNTTGDSMLVESGESFYSNIVNQSSIVTAIVMIILDILSVYVVPTFKLFFILGVFLLSVVLVLMSALKIDSERNFITRFITSLLKPMGLFFLITTGFAWVISLFMGSGNSAVTGELTPTISVGDPVVVMVIMVVLDLAVVFLYFRLLKGVWLEVVRGSQAVYNVFSGAVMGLGGAILGRVSDMAGGRSSFNSSDTGTPAQSSGVMGSSKLSDSSPASSATMRGKTSFNVFGDKRDSGLSGFGGVVSRNGKNGLNSALDKDHDRKLAEIERKIKGDVLKDKSKLEKTVENGVNRTTATASNVVDKVGTEAKKAADKVADDVKTAAKLMI